MRYPAALIALLISAFVYAAPFHPVSDIPATLKENALAVVRESKSTVKVRSINNAVVTDYRVITILHAEGQYLAALNESYSSQVPLTRFKVKWYDAEGNPIREFDRKDFKDRSAASASSLFEDTRERYLDEVPASYPVTIEIFTETIYKGYLNLPGFYPYPGWDISVQSASYTVTWPADKPEFLLVNQMPGPIISESNKLVWQVNDLPAKRSEYLGPSYFKQFPHILLAQHAFSYYGQKGDMSTWAGFGSWLYRLQECGDSLSPVTMAWLDSLVATEPDTLKRAQAIYRYMQRKTRYVSIQEGIGGFKPFPAYEVDHLGYGDCKGLVNLTRIMLKRAGIPSFTTAVLSGQQRFDGGSFVYAGYFNHVVLGVPVAGDTVWLECTNPYQRFGVISSSMHGAYGLWIDSAGSRPVKLHSADQGISAYISTSVVEVDTAGSAYVLITTRLTGKHAATARQHYLYYQPSEIKQWKQEMLSYPGLSINETPSWQNNQDSGWVTEHIKADVNTWVEMDKPYTATPVFPAILQAQAPRRYIRRFQPFEIPNGLIYIDTVTLKLPVNWQTIPVLNNSEVNSEFGSFIVQPAGARNNSREITMVRRLEIYPGAYTAKDYIRYLEFMESVIAAAQPHFPLIRKKQ